MHVALTTISNVLKTGANRQNKILHEINRKKYWRTTDRIKTGLIICCFSWLAGWACCCCCFFSFGENATKSNESHMKKKRKKKRTKKQIRRCCMRFVHEFVEDSMLYVKYKNLLTLRQNAHTIFTTAEWMKHQKCVYTRDDDAIYLFQCARECLLHSVKGNADALFRGLLLFFFSFWGRRRSVFTTQIVYWRGKFV